MAEECVDVPMITEATMSRVAGLRRHSSGKGCSGSNNDEKIVPHYLRASTGSCHDFCKFGRKLALEAKERSSIPKRSGRKPLHQGFGGLIMSVANNRASVDTELQISEVSEVCVNKNKTSLVRVKPSIVLQKSNSSSTSKTRRQENSSSSKVDTTSKQTSKRVGASSISASKKEEPQLKSTSEWVKTHPKSTSQVVRTLSKSASKKTRTSSKLSSFKDKEMNLSGKHVTSLSLESCKIASPLRASLSSKSFGKKRLGDINMRKSLENVSHVVNQPKPTEVEPEEQSNDVEEKTLYVIKVETENQTFQSDQNASQDFDLSLSHSLSSPKFSSSSVSEFSSQEEDQVESENATSEFEEDSSSGKEYMENLEALEVEENGKPQKDVDVAFEDKDCQKLSENLVETQIEKSSPKKLEFKRGKVLEDSATDVKVDSENIGATTGPEKIVLRHQDVKGKRDEQVLLNNVIEETASKLVEIQKSKVKALVDAFESIISLQEKNTYAANIVI